MKRYSSHLVIAGILVLVFILYLPIFSSFFQQDEWRLFGYFYSFEERGLLTETSTFLKPIGVGHYVPLTNMVSYVFFRNFGLNFQWYALLAIGGHITSVFLVFLLAKEIFRDFKPAIASALFFGVAEAGHQATSWPITSINIHGATIFALISALGFLEFVKGGRGKYLIFSLIFLLVSLLFKEVTIGLFLLYALILLLEKRNKNPKAGLAILISFAFIYVLFRILLLLGQGPQISKSFDTKDKGKANIVYNLATFPIKGISQTVVPINLLLSASRSLGERLPEDITGQKLTTAYDNFIEGTVLEILNVGVFLLIMALSFMYLRKKKLMLLSPTVFGLLFVIANSPIYALSPERQGKITIIDSRNLYFLLVGTSIFIVSLLFSFFAKRKLILYLALSLFLIINVKLLTSQLNDLVKIGTVRKDILQEIKNTDPFLPKKVIFYTESDTSYYGLPPEEKILPFQSGFGQTLLVWYYPSQKFPKEFFNEDFLWNIKSQGYKEISDYGFGYFRDYNLMLATIKKYNVPQEAVIAFSWKKDKEILRPITQSIRERIMADVKRKN